MFISDFRARGAPLRRSRLAFKVMALLAVASVGLASVAAANADPADRPTAVVLDQSVAATVQPLEAFDATGLPSGAAKGSPVRMTMPPGFSLKHVHGGNCYVYVLEGSLDIVDANGGVVTYNAGDFFWEPVGRVHTAQTSQGAQVFILRFLTPGAEATIPVT